MQMENSTEAVTTVLPVDDFGGLIALVTPPQWAFNVELVIMVTVFLVGVPGNTLIVLVQAKAANKTSTDYLVMLMAMYELLSSSLNTTTKIFRDIDALWDVTASVFVCKLTPWGYYFAQNGAGQTLGALAVDRCIKTLFPLSTWYGVKQANVVNVIIFISALTLSIPHFITHNWNPDLSMECALTFTEWMLGKVFGIVGSFIQAIVFIAMSLSYASIAIALKRRHIQKVSRRKKQLLSMKSSMSHAEEAAADDSSAIDTSSVVVSVNDQASSEVTSTNPTNNEKLQKMPNTKTKMLTLEGRNVNKLTALMFLISLIYVASNLILWYLFAFDPFAFGFGVLQLSFSIPMLNCISNPIMFFTMSSRFRNNVKLLLCKR